MVRVLTKHIDVLVQTDSESSKRQKPSHAQDINGPRDNLGGVHVEEDAIVWTAEANHLVTRNAEDPKRFQRVCKGKKCRREIDFHIPVIREVNQALHRILFKIPPHAKFLVDFRRKRWGRFKNPFVAGR